MSDKNLRTLVNELIERVTAENVVCNGLDDTLPGLMFSSTIPGGLTTEEEYVRQRLTLNGEAAVAYYECLYYMNEQSERGFLEHLTQREAQQRLWQFVSEGWVDRKHLANQTKRMQRITAFLNSVIKAHSPYEVEWIIDDLWVERALKVGSVEVVPTQQSRIGAEESKHDWLTHHEPQWRERAFAKVIISAGSADKALERAVDSIDDALHEVRHAMRDIRVVPVSQRRWQRGTLYLVTDLTTGTPPKGGWMRGWHSADLGLSGDMLTHIEGKLDQDGWLHDDSIKKASENPSSEPFTVLAPPSAARATMTRHSISVQRLSAYSRSQVIQERQRRLPSAPFFSATKPVMAPTSYTRTISSISISSETTSSMGRVDGSQATMTAKVYGWLLTRHSNESTK